MGRNRTRRNSKSSSAHSSKWRERFIKIIVTLVILGIITTLCCIMWKSEVYANAVSDVFLAILSTGLASEIVLFIVGEREKKKGDESEEGKNGYVYYAIVIAIAIVILIICLIAAKGYWGEHEGRNQGVNRAAEAMGENTEINENISLKQENSTKNINEFSWANNLYVINSSNYVTVSDKIDGLVILIENYIEALACAYNDSKASEDYISVIWDEIIKIYGELGKLDTLDGSHKEQALDMIEACDQCK